MEPAAWSCPVLYGPHTDNFDDARICLERSKGGILIHDADSLADQISMLLDNPDRILDVGNRARSALEEVAQGAASRQAEVILEQFRKSMP